MHRPHLLACALLTAALTGQDFIHYKFDSPCLTEVINYATGPSAFPSNGTLESNIASSSWVSGMFAGGLASGTSTSAYNRVRSGWNPSTQPLTGDLTMAFFLRQGSFATTSLDYLMGAPSGGFRLFTNGVANRGLVQREIVASGGNIAARDLGLLQTAADVQTLAAAGWVHIALVIDSAAGTAEWFVNGLSAQLTAGVGPANIVLNGPFTIGYYSNASMFDIDEFLLSNRAYSATEILALSVTPQAGDGPFSSGVTAQCGNASLSSFGGRPFLGNNSYGMQVATPTVGLVYLFVGFDRCSFGGVVPLPFDLTPVLPIAPGCWALTNFDFTFTGISTGGVTQLPLPVPGTSSFAGLTGYAQAAVADFSTGGIEASLGVSLSLGL